ncbi:MAG: hypothetical protein IPP19_08590 [Verrucomicrobia bacterium]|nr:hypothetical protein [Verrucomicrobiota bacterium]
MTTSGEYREQHSETGDQMPDDAIDLRDLFARLMRGLPQILGLALLGLALATTGFLIYSPFQTVSTSTRVSFAFPGFEKGEYPDKSKFQADDLRSPDVVVEALKRRGLDASSEFQSKIRAALSIEGIVPPNIIKDRDRLRAAGQTPPAYVPDEYTITLSIPRKFALSSVERQQLLGEIVNVYRENFRRTYADIPLTFGNAFTVLKDADYPDYESVFDKEMHAITTYLTQQSTEAKLFRSSTTNLTFSELLRQTQLFSQIHLNETLGLIHQNGLSRNRKIALVKMNDALRLLNDEERRAMDGELVVKELLKQTQNRDQNYVLGVKSQVSQSRANATVLDQGMIDSLLANDSYSFLVRRALEAGLKVKQVQADKSLVLEQIENMKSFSKENLSDQSAIIAEVQKSTKTLDAAYQELISNIKKTHVDFSRQQFGDAIRVSDSIRTAGTGIKPLMLPSVVGLFLGFAAGAGLSLLGVYIGRNKSVA